MLGVIRRAIDHGQHLRAGLTRERRRTRQPHVFADENTDTHASRFKHRRGIAMLEIAFIVKHRIIRQIHLAINRLDLAVAQHRSGVVKTRLIAPRRADDGRQFWRELCCQCFNLSLAGRDERRPQQQVFWLIGANRKFRCEQQIGVYRSSGLCGGNDFGGVTFEVTDEKIELGNDGFHG